MKGLLYLFVCAIISDLIRADFVLALLMIIPVAHLTYHLTRGPA